MNNPTLRKLASTVLALLLLLYVGYQIYRVRHAGPTTETADYFTASESVQASGIAIRSETVVHAGGKGVVSYVLNSGDKVAKGGTVALIFGSSAQASAHRQLENVENEIKKLKSLQTNGNTVAASPDTLNSQIGRELSGALGKAVSGDYKGLSDSRDSLLYLMNEKQMAAGKVSSFGTRIQSLQAQQASLKSQAGTGEGSVSSPDSGYFIRVVDGLENVIPYSSALSLSPEQIQQAQSRRANPPADVLGKVCGDYDWYFACVVPASRAAEFRRLMSGGTVSLSFPFVSNESVPASVKAVNQEKKNSDAAVILSCSYMNSSLASLRDETAQITLHSYTGIRVGKNTVHFADVSKTVKNASGKAVTQKENVEGVYVVNGRVIQFRQIFPEYSTDSYVVCDPDPPQEDLMTDSTIKLHDEVIVEGTDLYDGKVIG